MSIVRRRKLLLAGMAGGLVTAQGGKAMGAPEAAPVTAAPDAVVASR